MVNTATTRDCPPDDPDPFGTCDDRPVRLRWCDEPDCTQAARPGGRYCPDHDAPSVEDWLYDAWVEEQG